LIHGRQPLSIRAREAVKAIIKIKWQESTATSKFNLFSLFNSAAFSRLDEIRARLRQAIWVLQKIEPKSHIIVIRYIGHNLKVDTMNKRSVVFKPINV
jgi:hypothetical protein